jgi:hypothetical protein
MINTSASERTRQIRLLRGLATDSEKLGSYKSVYNPGLTLAALPKFFTKLDGGTRRASTTPPDPNPPPTISNFVIFEFYGPTYLPGGTAAASIDADITNATTASYVVYLASSPTTVVTGSQFLIVSGNNNVVAPTPQSIAIDPLASIPNLNFIINSAIASANGPYIVTLTATGPGGSISQSINVPIYMPVSSGPTPPV